MKELINCFQSSMGLEDKTKEEGLEEVRRLLCAR
jgi:hypothetical protein